MTCPHCNGRNFAWVRRCEHCGRPPGEAAVPEASVPPALPELKLAIPESAEVRVRDERRAALRAALAERGTRVVITPILMAVNIAMFVLIALQDQQILQFDIATLLRWGGSYSPDVTQGAWWRLMTAVFLHGGLLHLASNMFALAMIGPVTERLFGSMAFTVIYALAGLGGSLASEWWQPVSVGVGASGAIFGLYGGLFAFLWRRHTTLPSPVASSLRSGAVAVVVYSIIAGLTQAHIDNAGHLGGLIAGFIVGLALTASGDVPNVTAPASRSALAACIGVVIAAVTVAALPRYGDLRRNLLRFSDLEDGTLTAVQDSLRRVAAGELGEDESADAIDQLLAPWRAHRSTLVGLQLPPSDQPLVRHIVGYMAARERGWALTADAMRQRNVTLLLEAQAAHAAALGARRFRISDIRRSVRATESPAAAGITLGSSALNIEMRSALKLDEASTRLYNDQMAQVNAGRMSLPDVATAIDTRIIAPWVRQSERISALPLHGPPDWTRKPFAEYMQRRLDAWRLTARGARERSPALMNRAMVAQRDALAMLRQTQEQRGP